jgi:predicted O-methyltransferase YrrM
MKHFTARALRKVAHSIDPKQGVRVMDDADEFKAWLSYANAGMLEEGNHYCFDYAIRNLPSHAPIVEIGSFCGLSTNFLTYYKRKHGATNTLFNCDKWVFEGVEHGPTLGESQITHTEYRALVKDSYVRNVSLFSKGDLPHTVEMFSDEFFAAWRKREQVTDVFGRTAQLGGAISFCYIDGNHTYEYAKRDFENCDEFLEPGGFVFFDDSADNSQWEVRDVIKEIKRSGKYEVVVKNPNYLLRKK